MSKERKSLAKKLSNQSQRQSQSQSQRQDQDEDEDEFGFNNDTFDEYEDEFGFNNDTFDEYEDEFGFNFHIGQGDCGENMVVYKKEIDESDTQNYSENILKLNQELKIEGCAVQGKRDKEQDAAIIAAIPVVNKVQDQKSIDKLLSESVEECVKIKSKLYEENGSTLVVGYFNSENKTLSIRNLGDSRIFINFEFFDKETNKLVNKSVCLTTDHDVDNEKIMNILNADGKRKVKGSYLVGKKMMVQTTSSIGDLKCRTNKDPDKTTIDLEGLVQFLFGEDVELKDCEKIQIFAACDGLTEGREGKNSIAYDYKIKIEDKYKHSFVEDELKNEFLTFSDYLKDLKPGFLKCRMLAEFILDELVENETILFNDEEEREIIKDQTLEIIVQYLESENLAGLIERIFILSGEKSENELLTNQIKNTILYSFYNVLSTEDFTNLFSAIKKCFNDEDLSKEDLEQSENVMRQIVLMEVVDDFYTYYSAENADTDNQLLKEKLLKEVEKCIFDQFLNIANNADHITESLVSKAIELGSGDNVACVVATIKGSFFDNIQQNSDSIDVLLGVFDGHGDCGEKVSQLCKEVFEKKVLELCSSYDVHMDLLSKMKNCITNQKDILPVLNEEGELNLCVKILSSAVDKYLESTNRNEIEEGIWIINQMKILNFKRLCENNNLNFDNSKNDIDRVVKNLKNQIQILNKVKSSAVLNKKLNKPKGGEIDIIGDIEKCTKNLKDLQNKLRDFTPSVRLRVRDNFGSVGSFASALNYKSNVKG